MDTRSLRPNARTGEDGQAGHISPDALAWLEGTHDVCRRASPRDGPAGSATSVSTTLFRSRHPPFVNLKYVTIGGYRS